MTALLLKKGQKGLNEGRLENYLFLLNHLFDNIPTYMEV